MAASPLIRAAGLLLAAGYSVLIVSIYVRQPQTAAELTGGVASSLGVYQIDRADFDQGLRFFRNEQFEEARAALGRADRARQDATTQFYVAYSWYRQGWGRVYSDDALFGRGLEAVNRAIEVAPDHRVKVEDGNLGLKTADELRAELEGGLRYEVSDLNPLRVFRKRK
jgi:hypothetical protein